MVWLVILSELLPGAVKAGLHRGNGDGKGVGDLGVTAALLDEGQERPVLWAKLGQRMAEGVELLGVHRPRGLRHILVLGSEGQEDAAQLLAPEVVDAGVARKAKKPGLKLRRGLETLEGADHLDEDLLGEVLH